jgi:AcrR family transcriptional regulator
MNTPSTLPVPLAVKNQVAEHAIALICKSGIEQLSIKQIALSAKVSNTIILHSYSSLDNLLTYCVKNCFDALEVFITCHKHRTRNESSNIDGFWKMLVEFHDDHAVKAAVIYSYLKTPALFPSIAVKYSLMRSLAGELDHMEHPLKNCNNQIRFIAFIHLFKMAKQLAEKLRFQDLPNRQVMILNYFHNMVERELNSLLVLPIC